MEDFDTSTDAALPKAKPGFSQDPHRVRELSERNLEVAIGRSVRALFNMLRQANTLKSNAAAPAPGTSITSWAISDQTTPAWWWNPI
jgi:hypothetical protein